MRAVLYRCSNHQPRVYLCVFFVPQHGVRRPVLSIFLPTIHSAVAATIFTTYCMHVCCISEYFPMDTCVWVCTANVIKRFSCRDFSESSASGLLPTHGAGGEGGVSVLKVDMNNDHYKLKLKLSQRA